MKRRFLRSPRFGGTATTGQSLVEYLVLTCLIAVAAITVIAVVGRNIRENYANISNALRGDATAQRFSRPPTRALEARGFQNYMENTDVTHDER